MKKALEQAKMMADGIARLLHPLAEVVVHDLEKDEIYAIFNPLSRREVGDSSYLDRIDFDLSENVIGPYEKLNWDGRKMKSVSVVVKDAKGKAAGFLCVNLDISQFEGVQGLLNALLVTETTMQQETEALFKDDLYEQINVFVQGFCRDHQVSLDALSRDDKKRLVHLLAEKGAFDGKNAATYVGRVLKLSRATVYNYLKQRD